MNLRENFISNFGLDQKILKTANYRNYFQLYIIYLLLIKKKDNLKSIIILAMTHSLYNIKYEYKNLFIYQRNIMKFSSSFDFRFQKNERKREKESI